MDVRLAALVACPRAAGARSAEEGGTIDADGPPIDPERWGGAYTGAANNVARAAWESFSVRIEGAAVASLRVVAEATDLAGNTADTAQSVRLLLPEADAGTSTDDAGASSDSDASVADAGHGSADAGRRDGGRADAGADASSDGGCGCGVIGVPTQPWAIATVLAFGGLMWFRARIPRRVADEARDDVHDEDSTPRRSPR